MNRSILEFRENATVNEVINFFNLSDVNITNDSMVSTIQLFDLYEAYKTREREQLMMYKWVAYVLGSLIIVSNLTVVISSGLILRKGQQPKSTYLLLGNVSLADTIIGVSIIFGATVDNSLRSNQLCIFQIGMLVCPAMVSIFSVGLIAVDRYIYILHGLYYKRWFNTTRVRIGIVCIWMIGITLAFMPATGWVGKEIIITPRCFYVVVYPGELILFNSFLSTIPILIVTILYSIILIKALKNLRNIKASENSDNSTESDAKPRLRIYRGNTKTINNAHYKKYLTKNDIQLKRSASFNVNKTNVLVNISPKFKTTDDLNINKKNADDYVDRLQKTGHESNNSVCTVETNCSIDSMNEVGTRNKALMYLEKSTKRRKPKEPKKWRAITVVMLTSGSFLITWMPFFVTVTFYVFCQEKSTNPKCLNLYSLLAGPIATLAFLNSFLNPLIYAWWHKGFQTSIKNSFRKYFCST